jgi:chlorite dismutase
MTTDKLSIANETAQLNLKNRNFVDELDETERKKFSTFLMMKYSANVEGNADLQEWYLRASNERVNQQFFDLGRHPKLQWLCCTTVSPGMGRQRHYWLAGKKREGNLKNKHVKFLTKLYPALKTDEIELLASINTEQDLIDYALTLGMSDQEIKKELK